MIFLGEDSPCDTFSMHSVKPSKIYFNSYFYINLIHACLFEVSAAFHWFLICEILHSSIHLLDLDSLSENLQILYVVELWGVLHWTLWQLSFILMSSSVALFIDVDVLYNTLLFLDEPYDTFWSMLVYSVTVCCMHMHTMILINDAEEFCGVLNICRSTR